MTPRLREPRYDSVSSSSDNTKRAASSVRRRNFSVIDYDTGLRMKSLCLPLQSPVTLAVIAATLLNPLQAAISTVCLVNSVLLKTGEHACLAGGLTCVFL